MNPELSRRVGAVMSYPPLADLRVKQRLVFLDAIELAFKFEDLTPEHQRLVLDAEAYQRRHPED